MVSVVLAEPRTPPNLPPLTEAAGTRGLAPAVPFMHVHPLSLHYPRTMGAAPPLGLRASDELVRDRVCPAHSPATLRQHRARKRPDKGSGDQGRHPGCSVGRRDAGWGAQPLRPACPCLWGGRPRSLCSASKRPGTGAAHSLRGEGRPH